MNQEPDGKSFLEGFSLNDNSPSSIPKIMLEVKLGDLIGVVLNPENKEDFKGDFYSGFVHIIGYNPNLKDKFIICLKRGHPLNNGSIIGEDGGEDIESSIINARNISQYRIYGSFNCLERNTD